ncbi:MAG: HAD-IIIA family hydrolase [bacterium]
MRSKQLYRSALKKIKLVLLDVDGVMTDGGVYYSAAGEELKKFNTKDGYGIVKLQRAGVRVGIITGRNSPIVDRRARQLGIIDVYQNAEEKIGPYEDVKRKYALEDQEIAYIGDDEFDIPVLQRVGVSAAPSDAVPRVKHVVQYVCRRVGGDGAVRELIDLILDAQAPPRKKV